MAAGDGETSLEEPSPVFFRLAANARLSLMPPATAALMLPFALLDVGVDGWGLLWERPMRGRERERGREEERGVGAMLLLLLSLRNALLLPAACWLWPPVAVGCVLAIVLVLAGHNLIMMIHTRCK